MKLLIETQVYENYGAHDWDGEGECPQYWKAKGGDTYFVMDVEPGTEERVVETVRDQVEFSNPIAQEYIIDYCLVDDDFMTRDEQLQLEYEGKILYPTRVLQENVKPEVLHFVYGGG